MKLIRSLLNNNIKHLVYENGVENTSFIENAKVAGLECISVLDARSAVYYATGICAQNNEIVVVCLESVNSRSAFSGMTEAFYRKLPIILITLGSELDYSKELRDAVSNHYVISDDSDLCEILTSEYPIHIEIINISSDAVKIECNQLLEILSNALKADDYLYIGQKISDENQEYACKVVRGALKNAVDGVLSNVLGASLAKIRRRYIGLVSEEEFLHDMNALGNINMNDLILYIVICEREENSIKEYASALGFKVEIKDLHSLSLEEVKEMVINKTKSVLILRKKRINCAI